MFLRFKYKLLAETGKILNLKSWKVSNNKVGYKLRIIKILCYQHDDKPSEKFGKNKCKSSRLWAIRIYIYCLCSYIYRPFKTSLKYIIFLIGIHEVKADFVYQKHI